MNTSVTIGILIIAALVLIYIVATRAGNNNSVSKKSLGNYKTIEDKYNAERRAKELELDALLDKIAKKGIESLSKKEKERLDQLSTKK